MNFLILQDYIKNCTKEKLDPSWKGLNKYKKIIRGNENVRGKVDKNKCEYV